MDASRFGPLERIVKSAAATSASLLGSPDHARSIRPTRRHPAREGTEGTEGGA